MEANSGRGILARRESVATKQMVKKSLECVAGVMGSKPILGSMESCKQAHMGANFLETKEETWIEHTENVHFCQFGQFQF